MGTVTFIAEWKRRRRASDHVTSIIHDPFAAMSDVAWAEQFRRDPDHPAVPKDHGDTPA